MSAETITLTLHNFARLGTIHRGVGHEGFVAVAGDPRNIADGQDILVERASRPSFFRTPI